MKPTSELAGAPRTPDGKFPPGKSGNPKGKGGFQERPEDINAGGRPKNAQRYDYWLQFFKDMSVGEFEGYAKTHPVKDMYMAERQAYNYLAKSDKDFFIFRTIADRTEGRAQQSIDHTNDGDKFDPIVIYRPEKLVD